MTQLGQQIAATAVPQSLEPDAAADFDGALDAYERAKEALAAATHPDDLQWVSRSLDDGRFALARLEPASPGDRCPTVARRASSTSGTACPVADALWAPEGGPSATSRLRGLRCAHQGRPGSAGAAWSDCAGDRPYYDAGAEYGPWARGWYGASGMYMLNGMLMGTMLMHAMYLPAGYDYFDPSADGGDAGA